jgi:hypothetical protein
MWTEVRQEDKLAKRWKAAMRRGKRLRKGTKECWATVWKDTKESWAQLSKKQTWTRLWSEALVFNWFDIKPEFRDYVEAGKSEPPSCTEIFNDYSRRGEWQFRTLRVVPVTLAYFLFAFSLFTFAAEFPTNPYRGALAHYASTVILFVGVLLMIGLAFLVLDATQLCQRFVIALKLAKADWNSKEVDRLCVERGATSGDEQKDIRELFTIQIIGQRTNVACKAIIYPFIIVFALIVARHPSLAYLDIGWVLLVVWTSILGMGIFGNLAVRRAAAQTREEVLYRLRAAESVAAGAGRAGSIRLRRLRLLIEEVSNAQEGALGPWYSNWVLRALAIPLGGGTGILLIEQFLPSLFV